MTGTGGAGAGRGYTGPMEWGPGKLIALALGGALLGGAAFAQQPSRPHPVRRDAAPTVEQPVEVRRAERRGVDWPGFLGPTGDGKSPETGILTAWPEGGPPVLWQLELGEGYSMPSVAAGRLYAFDRHGDRQRLTCLDAATGAELWRSEHPVDYEDYYGFSNGPRTSPVVDGDRVYTFGVAGRLRCHSTADGKLLWEVDTAKRFGVVKNFFGVGSTPVIEGDLLIAQIGGSPPGSPPVQSGRVRGNGSGIVAFDKRSGEVRYSITDELASYSSPVLATIEGRRWAFVLARNGLIAFDPRSGELRFQVPWRATKTESVNAANPVVAGDMVFITESYGPGAALLRVKPDGFEVLRKDPPGRGGSLRSHWSTPIHHEGWLYGCSGSGSGDAELRAVNLLTGEIGWSKDGLGRTTLLYADGHLVVLGEYGKLLLVRATPERYEQVAEVELRDEQGDPLLAHPAWNAPILSRGRLYVRGKDRLVCLDLGSSGPRPATRAR